MKGYLFDATSLIEVLRAAPTRGFVRKLATVPSAERWTSATSVGDLFYFARRVNNQALMNDLLKLVSAVRVLPFDLAAAHMYSKLVASVDWAGSSLSATDLMTVALARTNDLTLVTRRPHQFQNLTQLRVEDWTTL